MLYFLMSGNEEREREKERASVQVTHKLIQVLAKNDGFLQLFKDHALLRIQCYFYVILFFFNIFLSLQSNIRNDAC